LSYSFLELTVPPPSFEFSLRNFCEFGGFQDAVTDLPKVTLPALLTYKLKRAAFRKYIGTRIRCKNGMCRIIDV